MSNVQTDTQTIAAKSPLPNGWRWVRLEEVCHVVNGFGFPEAMQGKHDLPYPFVKVSDMNAIGSEMVVSNAANTVDRSILNQLRAKAYPPGTVIFPKVGGALLTNKKRLLGVEATFDNNVMGLVPKQVDPYWLLYWMLTVDLRALSNTQALPSIKQSRVASLDFPLPPVIEQQRIAAILTHQMTAIDRARAAAEVRYNTAKSLPTAYLRGAFTSLEAQRWPKKRIGDVLQLRKEVVHPHDNPKGAVSFVGLEHIEPLTGRRIGSVDVEMAQLTGRKPRFHKGDIVYGYLRPYLNKVWVAEFEGLCSVDQYVYSVLPELAVNEFVAWFMRSPVFLDRAPIETTPGQLPRIRTEEVASVEINLPMLGEQKRVLARITEQMLSAERTRNALGTQLATINALPAALLRQAFEGKL